MDKTGHMTIAAHTAGRRNGRQWMRRFLLAAVLLLAVRRSLELSVRVILNIKM